MPSSASLPNGRSAAAGGSSDDEPAAVYRRFRDRVFGVGDRVADSDLDLGLEFPPEPPPEIEIQSRWFSGEFGRSFLTTDGAEVEMIHFGCWNRGAGPDFTDAVITVDGDRRRGSIEIDTHIKSWDRHGHSANPAYGDVALHLFVTGPQGGERYFTRTADHRQVPQVQLDLAAAADRGVGGRPVYWQFLPGAKLGRCSEPLRDMDASRILSLLEAAARCRLEEKGRRIRSIEEIHGWKQAMFHGVAEALGYRHNKLAMRIIAQRLPISDLRKAGPEAAEALLFGVAGFLDAGGYESASADTRDYLRSLWESWWKLRAGFSPDRRPPWNLAGIRPANHPQRRLGALARIADRWNEFCRLVDPARPFDPKKITAWFASLSHPYWDRHFTVSSKRSAKPMALVGSSRAADILANWIVPFRAATDSSAVTQYLALPAELDNEMSRRAALRLLGNHPARAQLTDKLFHLQGLLQIYRDFCLADPTDCADCPFPEQLKEWGF